MVRDYGECNARGQKQDHAKDGWCMASQAYEARFNPFAEFQQSEEVSRVKSLPVHDRAILSGTR